MSTVGAMYHALTNALPEPFRRRVTRAVDRQPVRRTVSGWEMLLPRGTARQYAGNYEPVTTRWIRETAPTTTGALVDVGAHVGYYTLLLATTCPDRQVIAYEPVAENLKLLRKNVATCPRVEVIDAAVGERTGPRGMRIVTSSSEHGFYASPRTELRKIETVEEVRLDALPEPIGFVKIDTEGAEIEALNGLGAMRPHLVVEWAPHIQEAAGRHPMDLIDWLTGPYAITVLADMTGRTLSLDATLDEYRHGTFDGFANLACVPRTS
jgi:FkbM family methyltransferase